ncbi:hypothetical protein DEO72_LG5g2379 [Vigna unguiculata]|uniref:Uncharacterized protein n=1 Tax=Vigna unguiculata TaxID=3917 RepID=A0A4D6M280_VIGUN|nr:hypothetical protein DEO72_LG5g2379 [Vigna unguiculata]
MKREKSNFNRAFVAPSLSSLPPKLMHVKTDWEPCIFAQASSSRLSENIKNSPMSLHEVSPRRAGFG